ncbi:MAG: hypothetical protein AAF489_00325 [Bacteroidota bacterium]
MSKPSDCISVAEAKQLQANWMTTHEPNSSALGGGGTEHVCAVTFNIDQLQEYLTYVKEECADKGNASPGIRVYFAANSSGTEAAVAGSTTVFFCPTESDAGDAPNNYDLEPLNKGVSGWPPNAY